MKSLASAAHHIGGQPMFKLLQKAGELERQGRTIYHFEIGDPGFKTPTPVIQATVDALLQGKTHYTESSGSRELKEAIISYTAENLGFKPTPGQVLVIPANAVIYFLMRCLVNPDEEVLMPDPGFSTYYSAAEFTGAKIVRVPLREENAFRINPKDIRDRITDKTRLLIINSPQNPTGSLLTPAEVEKIALLCKEKDIYLLSDEVYREMIHEKVEYMSPSYLDHCRERTFLLNSFSKSHAMSGFRLGYVIGPEEAMEKMALLMQTIFSCMPPFIQAAGIAALEEDSSKDIKGMMRELRKRRDFLVDALNQLPGVTCLKPGGAFYVFPNIRGTGMTSDAFANLMLEKAGVALLPGTAFGKYGEGYARLCYATLRQPKIAEALAKMKTVLEAAGVSK